jgi:hypothetical protein
MNIPSKKVISVLAISIAVVSVPIYLSIKNDKLNISGVFVPKSPVLTDQKRQDADNDNLLDWEEDLWGTDMLNPDTDGDGTLDGDEVRKGRNPLIVGPNDFVSIDSGEYYLIEQKKASDGFQEGSITDNLSKRLFTDFFTIEDDGSLGTKGGNETLQQLLNQSLNEVVFTQKYTSDDIKTFDASNIEKLTTYGEKVADLEIQKLIALSIIPENENSPDKIISIISKHQNDLVNIEVPSNLLITHLSIVNDYGVFNEALSNIDKHQNDPIKAVVSLRALEEVQLNQEITFSGLAEYFRSRGIIFNEEQTGILWNQY